MIFDNIRENLIVEDEEFNAIYPKTIRNLAKRHWTPVAVATIAADYLVEKPGTKVLDIGSGVGKFCMIGSVCTRGVFTGVEQRKNLVALSNKILKQYKLPNIEFIHANIVDIPFSDYDAFYYFNPFHENLDNSDKIDNKIKLVAKNYEIYTLYVREQLAKIPVGGKLVTYYGSFWQIPSNFDLEYSEFNGKLVFWKKNNNPLDEAE
jgi:SAM-dependent methyltransferase